MERLTQRIQSGSLAGSAVYPNYKNDTDDEIEECFDIILERLAEYEDCGLMPSEVSRSIKGKRTLCKKHISGVSKEEVEILFKIAKFDGFKITKLEKDSQGIDCLVVYAESEWGDDETITIEDAIVCLFPTTYEDYSPFSNGFKLSMSKYIQWALWCGLIEPIDFDVLREGIKTNDTATT